jgi:hypothetical protein
MQIASAAAQLLEQTASATHSPSFEQSAARAQQLAVTQALQMASPKTSTPQVPAAASLSPPPPSLPPPATWDDGTSLQPVSTQSPMTGA